ncbi:MAG: fumarylacetoacetate hydrolase family protein [Hyphomicrobiales bacterium]|nr:fumarylacetoacetate hydrolase family protein [Hyphomicrobiales bacterium]
MPPGSEKTDWELELDILIGQPAKHVSQDDAIKHVSGYCVVHDISEHAFQLKRGGQWVKVKSYDCFGPIGPRMVTADEIGDPQNLRL